MKKLAISVVLLNLLAACASDKPAEVSSKSAPEAAQSSSNAAPSQAVEMDPLNDPNSLLVKRSVYYPFDVDAVQEADKPVVEAHGRYLAGHQARSVRLEGNCDERGSNEYNLALGQRRADGVKRMLELTGANAGQLESVSYGEEKPRDAGHNEAAWSQNRRTDLNYTR